VIFDFTKATDGVDIRIGRMQPDGDIKGVIQMAHGFGEGIEHYDALSEFFAERGFALVVHDQRGFGKLAKRKGVTPGYKYFLSDIKMVRNKISEWYPNKPVILYGFSMGGNIAINYLLKYGESDYVKLIIESPWFNIRKPLPKRKSIPVRIISFFSRTATTSTGPYTNSTRKDDGIHHNRISFRLLTEINNAGKYAVKNADKINLPTLFLYSTKDNVVSLTQILKYLDAVDDNVKSVEYHEEGHSLFRSAVSEQMLNEIAGFIKEDKTQSIVK